jgi:hypothetical protein
MIYVLYNADMLNHYARKCHNRAVAKGFWDVPHSIGHSLMLAYGELHEAIEADRLGKWAKLDPNTIDTLHRIEGAIYTQEFLRLVKDTVEDEIADAVIRLLDLLGWSIESGTPLVGLDYVRGEFENTVPPKDLPGALLRVVCSSVLPLSFCSTFEAVLAPIKSLEQLCDHLGIDLMAHIDLKLKYNATRPALHGKKY